MKSVHKSKQAWLSDIVSGMGPEATPAQIREEAYRVGFGVVSHWMLIVVRNALWPERKRSGGFTKEQRKAREFKPRQFAFSLIPCPNCGSDHVSSNGGYRRRDGSNTITRRRHCRSCDHRFLSVEPNEPLPSQAIRMARAAALTEKACSLCRQTKPIDCFGFKARSDVFRRARCRECEANERAKYVARDRVKKYGITASDYQAILRLQGGRCAICKTNRPFGRIINGARKRKRRTLSVDHCHATGKVRGLLCARCNIAIGNFADDTNIMRAAIAYLESHRQSGASDA